MTPSHHCQLCENQVYDLQYGSKCGLTQALPTFKEKCQEIEFGQKYEDKIREVNEEHELVKRTKMLSMANFFFFLAASIAFIAAGYLLGKHILSEGWISNVPIIIMGVGVLILPLAFGPFNKYRWSMKIANQKKQDLDKLLAIYNIQYTINVTVKKDLHGNQDVTSQIHFQRKYYR